jgi:hypothetical protein
LSVHTNTITTNRTLFVIASSTAAATTTLYSVSNTGLIDGLNFSLVSGTATGSFAVTGSYASTTNFFANGLRNCASNNVRARLATNPALDGINSACKYD